MMTRCHGETKNGSVWNRQTLFFNPWQTYRGRGQQTIINPALCSAQNLAAVGLTWYRHNLTLHAMVRQPRQQVLTL